MSHSLGILSSGVKFVLNLVHFMTNLELQLQEVTKCFSYFWLQLVRMKSCKKWCPQFLIAFLPFEILTYVTFLFLLKLVLKIANPSKHKNRTFFKKSPARLLPLMYTAFKEITPRIFWVRVWTLYAYKGLTLSEGLYFLIGTVNLIDLQD